ncbi:hypothetical protein NQ317_012316 [Molorchus minor]|uniref:WD repeat domain-containing protein 83 n=1 Tax=Molorchus minor TaxID=1323400 RepID=A0ABQ9J470_9CUCU|nr:hypothetical protein NQ317_012316 [Molorchus minor]
MCWDIRSRSQTPVQVLKEAKDCINSVQVTDHEILTGSVDCTFRRYDLKNGRLDADFVGAAITSVSFSHDVSAEVVRKLVHTPGKVLNSLNVHPTKDIILTSSVGTIKVWGAPEESVIDVEDGG